MLRDINKTKEFKCDDIYYNTKKSLEIIIKIVTKLELNKPILISNLVIHFYF